MEGEGLDIIDCLTQAIITLNKLDEYMGNLDNRLSECDSLISDYEHFIENTPIEQVNLEKLYLEMQNNFKKRRLVKNDITLKDNFKNLSGRLNNTVNREFLLQNMKTANSKLEIKYHNRILTSEQIENFSSIPKENNKRGRPKKVEEGM